MRCKVCDNSTRSIDTDIYKCNKCGHLYIHFKGDGLQYHKEEYRNCGHGTRVDNEIENGIFTDNFHDARTDICKNRSIAIDDLVFKCETLLDIGAGGGTFVNTIKDMFLEVDCQEISDICINNLQRDGFNVYSGNFNEVQFNKKYDLVTCWHVLEHIDNLHIFIEQVSKVVNKFLVIEVPINRSIRNPNIEWDGHYHYFSETSLRLLFDQDFSIIKIKEGIQRPALLAILEKKR